MLPIKYDLQCVLLNMTTGEEVQSFAARELRERSERAGWAGSGIASNSHDRVMATAAEIEFKPGDHCVVVDGERYYLAGKRYLTYKPFGGAFGKLPRETVLELGGA